ncbi:MAG: sec-independent protein translocase protein TatA [Verrucomicrobia bacterium]|nr:MAG: sec-independent protein translocase protein TatA [Verrucomicrobiota bacterium]
MLIIFLIVLIMFGAKKLPELAKGLGQAVREFSKAKEDMNSEINRAAHVDPASYHPPANHPPVEQALPPAPVAAPVAAPTVADAVHAVPASPAVDGAHAAPAVNPVPVVASGLAPVSASAPHA